MYENYEGFHSTCPDGSGGDFCLVRRWRGRAPLPGVLPSGAGRDRRVFDLESEFIYP
jgi:hypothetical protein